MLLQPYILTFLLATVVSIAIGCSDSQTNEFATTTNAGLKFDESIEAAERVNLWERQQAELEQFETLIEQHEGTEQPEAMSPDNDSN